jgi:hypothetical protein
MILFYKALGFKRVAIDIEGYHIKKDPSGEGSV